MSQGKGSRVRVGDWARYRSNYDSIFKNASIAQRTEHRSSKPRVAGSKPAGSAK